MAQVYTAPAVCEDFPYCLHKNLHLQINVLFSAGVPTVSNVTQSLAWHYPEVATVAADFRICKAPPAPTRPSLLVSAGDAGTQRSRAGFDVPRAPWPGPGPALPHARLGTPVAA